MTRNNKILTQGKLSIRRFHDEDRDILVRLADNPNVSKYLAPRFPYPYKLEDAENWLLVTRSESQPYNFGLDWQGELIGGIGLDPCSGLFARTAELGYWLGEPYWGKGLAARAVKLFLPYVFKELSFLRVQAIVFAENGNSMGVLEKNGFTREGILRKHICKNGLVTDAVLYAKLACDEPLNDVQGIGKGQQTY